MTFISFFTPPHNASLPANNKGNLFLDGTRRSNEMAARIDIEGQTPTATPGFNCKPSEVYRVQTTMPEAMASVWDQRKWDGFRQEIDAVLLAPSSTLRKISKMRQDNT